MSIVQDRPHGAMLRHELSVLSGQWFWYLALGLLQIVLGTVALGAPLMATFATVALLAGLLIAGGAIQILGAFWARRWSGFFALLLSGVLYLTVGVLSLDHPDKFAEGLTLMIAAFLVAGGLFRVVAAVSIRFPNWGWLALNGLVTMFLGLFIWRSWPSSGLQVIGLFVGIELIFNGWTWVMLAMGLRRLSVKIHSKGHDTTVKSGHTS